MTDLEEIIKRLDRIEEAIAFIPKKKHKHMMYDYDCHTTECKEAYVKRWHLQFYNPPFTPNDVCICGGKL